MSFPSTTTEGPRNTQNWLYLSGYLITGKGAPEGKVKGRIGAIYIREDGVALATLYVKEAKDGTAEGWELLAGGNRDYGLVTALPTTPTPAKGDTCRFIAGSGVIWDLIYDGEGAYPWKKIGGPPLREEDLNTRETTSTSYQTTGAPSITTPLAGEYRVSWGATEKAGVANVAAGDAGYKLQVFEAGAETGLISEGRYNDQHRGGPADSTREREVAKSKALQTRYRALNGNGAYLCGLFVEIDPLQVG